MKILIFNTLYFPNIVGGAEKSVQLLAERLLQRGHTPVIVSSSKEDKINVINGVKVYYLKYRNLYWASESNDKSKMKKVIWHGLDNYNPFLETKISEIISIEKPDVVHTNNLVGLSTLPWISAKKHNIPIVHTLRDFSLMCSKGTMFRDSKNCKDRCVECSILTEFKKYMTNKNYVNYVIGNSKFMVNRHKELGFFRDVPSKRIYNGAVIRNESSNKKIKSENHNNKPIKFFYMGRIEETKGVNLLLNTFKNISQAELLLAGKVTDNKIQSDIDNKSYPDNIKFLGYIDPEDILPDIDVLIAPSLWNEPLPRVILEAYSHEVPVIGSTRGGIPECIIHNETGFLFNPDIKEEFERIVTNIVEKPELLSTFKPNIKSYIKQFDIEKSVDDYITTYNSVCQNK
ncbi:glycosyltransferase family 4 protein [Bacillus sp. PS06]|uniref:glycosyltransferase family 4 protein n=1 Tax=Bacillus sp. PS06 TaxID=2764176 RepID=UPI00177CD372|nr:glycosyltransferase family 4 protein [Bacillus sp. PS06]MBD8069401.1 glycosyltransferase family 4 protein [Bacillus sp. PS06]